jgi:hypothetical protein
VAYTTLLWAAVGADLTTIFLRGAQFRHNITDPALHGDAVDPVSITEMIDKTVDELRESFREDSMCSGNDHTMVNSIHR